MIENKFLHYETQAAFDADMENIPETSIVFVKENRRIYTHGAEYGSNLRSELGYDPGVSVSQKTITEALNAIWDKIDEITGEGSRKLIMNITPRRFFGGDSCTAHVTVIAQIGNFEEVVLYVNDNIVARGKNRNIFEWDILLTGDSTIVCKATIFGKEYTARDKVYNRRVFFIGAGTSYTDVLDDSHLVTSTDLRDSIDVTFQENDRLYVVLEDSMLDSFIRADMNGFEIPFDKSAESVIVDGVSCTVFSSKNTYKAGTYNIDING